MRKADYDFSVSGFSVTSVSQPPVEATQRDHAGARVRQIKNKLIDDLRKQFYLDAEAAPGNAYDLIKAIKEDNFSLNEKQLEEYAEQIENGYYGNMFGIRWGKNKPDAKGFKVAKQALDVVAQDVADTVALAPIDEVRQALKDFQNWKYSA